MSLKTLAGVAVVLAVAGCSLSQRAEPRRDTFISRLGGGGQVIEPKRCALTVWILPRPLRDKVVNQAIWGVADEQSIAPETRRLLEANGIRMGVLTGGLPVDVEAALNAKPPNRIDPAEFNVPEGANTLVTLGEAQPEASLFLNLDGRAFGRDYKDAGGWFRVTATQDGPTGVALRFVPEIHHGPIRRQYDAVQNAAASMSAMQFMVKDGQQEDTLRELAASITLQPGQIAVIGCDPERRGSLGAFLFTHPEANSDRLSQQVLIVRASRSNLGVPGSGPTPRSVLDPVEAPDLPASARKKPAESGKVDAHSS